MLSSAICGAVLLRLWPPWSYEAFDSCHAMDLHGSSDAVRTAVGHNFGCIQIPGLPAAAACKYAASSVVGTR